MTNLTHREVGRTHFIENYSLESPRLAIASNERPASIVVTD